MVQHSDKQTLAKPARTQKKQIGIAQLFQHGQEGRPVYVVGPVADELGVAADAIGYAYHVGKDSVYLHFAKELHFLFDNTLPLKMI